MEMKKLFAMVNPKGKSKEQLVNEVWDAFIKFKEAENKVSDNWEIDKTAEEEGTGYQIMGIPQPPDK